mmetsp:Transcript_32471/g.58283  ORF Transcript_32471/g.58283 Transcript_32471/m.58283 type:complete len:87 (-) Transcript_32471:728-988(-)
MSVCGTLTWTSSARVVWSVISHGQNCKGFPAKRTQAPRNNYKCHNNYKVVELQVPGSAPRGERQGDGQSEHHGNKRKQQLCEQRKP